MAKTKVNKSEEVRKYLESHPEEGPSAVAEALKHLKISPAYVSNIKLKMKTQEGGPRPKRGRPQGSTSKQQGSNVDQVVAAAQFIRNCGGIEQARQALSAAQQVVDAIR